MNKRLIFDERFKRSYELPSDGATESTEEPIPKCFDLTGEIAREYSYPEHYIRISNPWRLFIAESGSHRVQTLDGNVHYIRPGWISLSWLPQDVNNPVAF